MSDQTTKDHILISTLEAIEKHGLENLTTRLIAEEAGVNNAALHYYYGTKENLIKTAINHTANQMLEDSQAIMSGDASIDTRLRELLVYIIEGVERYPNVLRIHLMRPQFLMEGETQPTQLLNAWITMAGNGIRESGFGISHQQIKFSLDMIFSYVVMSGLFRASASEDAWMDLSEPVTRERFLRQAIDMLI